MSDQDRTDQSEQADRGGQDWSERRYHGVSAEGETTIPLTVRGGDHPLAIIVALKAPRAVAAAQHLDKLAELHESELYFLLNDVRKLASAAASIEEDLIVAHRAAGGSWAQIGAALEVTRASARERHDRIVAAHARGLTVRGAAEQDARAAEAEPVAGGASATGNTVIVQSGDSVTISFDRGGQDDQR